MMPATITTNAPVGPADLDARAAEQRHEEAADDRRVDAGLRRDARGDAERHRQRQRDDADRDAGHDVADQVGARVGPECVDQRWAGSAPGMARSLEGSGLGRPCHPQTR